MIVKMIFFILFPKIYKKTHFHVNQSNYKKIIARFQYKRPKLSK